MNPLTALLSNRSTLAAIVIVAMLGVGFGLFTGVDKIVEFFKPIFYLFGAIFILFLALTLFRNFRGL